MTAKSLCWPEEIKFRNLNMLTRLKAYSTLHNNHMEIKEKINEVISIYFIIYSVYMLIKLD
jgi:hypothetical protein